jgi:Arc/MetJ family transcription regulator
MRATLNIPDDLIAETQKTTGMKSKTKAITIALEEYLRLRKTRDLLALRGKVEIDYDWRAEEEREIASEKKRGKANARKK